MTRLFSWGMFVLAIFPLSAWGQGFDLAKQVQKLQQQANIEQRRPLTDGAGPYLVRAGSYIGDENKGDAEIFANYLEQKYRVKTYTYRFVAGTNYDAPSKEWRDAYIQYYGVKPRLQRLANPPPPNWVVMVGDFETEKSAETFANKLRKISLQQLPEEIANSLPSLVHRTKGSRKLDGVMTLRNPLLPREPDAVDTARLKMLLDLNSDQPYSIYDLQAPVTLRVARFAGVSVAGESRIQIFNKKSKMDGMHLAAQNATILTETMRKMGIEAYVFHGKHASLVCVGGYQSGEDPQLQKDMSKLANMKIGELQLVPGPIPTPKRPTF